MIRGITPEEETIIKGILKRYPYNFYYYGSRVKGNFTKASDLDILVESKNEIPSVRIETIEREFNESKIPYIVNITNRANIEDYFYNLIKDTLVEV